MNAPIEMRNCRSCRKLVRFVKTAATGSPMPLDEDCERGNVLIDAYGLAHVFRNHEAALAAAAEREDMIDDGFTYISHHARGQCPHGDQWRGKRRRDHDAPKAPAQQTLEV